MLNSPDEFPSANLGFFLNFTDGSKKDEIESELMRIIFQGKELTHYDRQKGGSFENLEQDKNNEGTHLLFISNIISSVYWLNESKGFNPYIVVDFSDIETEIIESKFIIKIQYRLLQDLQTQGEIKVPL